MISAFAPVTVITKCCQAEPVFLQGRGIFLFYFFFFFTFSFNIDFKFVLIQFCLIYFILCTCTKIFLDFKSFFFLLLISFCLKSFFSQIQKDKCIQLMIFRKSAEALLFLPLSHSSFMLTCFSSDHLSLNSLNGEINIFCPMKTNCGL